MSARTSASEGPTAAIQRSLDALLRALELEPLGEGRYSGTNEESRFDRLFGGQLLAQGLIAAGHTTAPKLPHSLHAYFVEAGEPEAALEFEVERVRDGRSFSTRRVVARQNGRTLLVLFASFHLDEPGFERTDPAPDAPAPESLPTLQDWIARLPQPAHERAQLWTERPPPLELRLTEAPTFAGGPPTEGPRPHWLRLPRRIGDDPLLQAALLAYASDYLLLDITFRALPPDALRAGTSGFSLDHAMWLHRPARVDEWLLTFQDSVAVHGERGLVRGRIYDRKGQLVASVMQETLVRPTPWPSGSRAL